MKSKWLNKYLTHAMTWNKVSMYKIYWYVTWFHKDYLVLLGKFQSYPRLCFLWSWYLDDTTPSYLSVISWPQIRINHNELTSPILYLIVLVMMFITRVNDVIICPDQPWSGLTSPHLHSSLDSTLRYRRGWWMVTGKCTCLWQENHQYSLHHRHQTSHTT